MSTTQEKSASVKGGEFIIKESSAENTFIPEEFNEEHLMIQQTAHDFLKQEVQTCLDRIDAMEPGLMPSLMDKSGQLGLLGVSVPEEYGGFGKDFITATLLTETLGAGHSFSVAFAAHTGIGTLPILYFGTPEQKQKYLPKLATGEWKASYCLTEPGSGSDALAAKPRQYFHQMENITSSTVKKCGLPMQDLQMYSPYLLGSMEISYRIYCRKNYSGLTR